MRRVYDSPAWKYLRRLVLSASAEASETGLPVCAVCSGYAKAVDHVIGIVEAPHLAFEATNLRPICKSCNSRKAARRRCLTQRAYAAVSRTERSMVYR